MKNIIVKKFGGATVATPEKIRLIAKDLVSSQKSGQILVIVVSAMGKTTNNLIELALHVSNKPNRREMDMLLSVGERISMSLLAMAIQDQGGKAISLTGSQAGILTSKDHENALVMAIKPTRVKSEILSEKMIILAGFQGVDPDSKEITTLGRGGSDTTAVAISAALGAQECQILKDIPSIFTADPNIISNAKVIEHLHYEELLDMTFWGAKVLHYRSAELAAMKQVSLIIGPSISATSNGPNVYKGTRINSFMKYSQVKSAIQTFLKSMNEKKIRQEEYMETTNILGINSHEKVISLEIENKAYSKAISFLKELLLKNEIIFPQILACDFNENKIKFYITGPSEALHSIEQLPQENSLIITSNLSSITVTCTGTPDFAIQNQLALLCKNYEESIERIQVSALSVHYFVFRNHRDNILKSLHNAIS